MNDNLHLIAVFRLDAQRYALDLSVVERIVPIVEFAPLPSAPDVVAGVVNVGGLIVPVLNIRQRLQLPGREIALSDLLIIANTSKRTVAIVVDTVLGILEIREDDVTPANAVLPGIEYVEGVLKLPDGIVLIHDLDTFLSLEEEETLENSMYKA